jgi:excisionase family DNA binding protein
MTVQDRSSTDLAGDSTIRDRAAFVSVAEAAKLLGVSTATVKRRIRDGLLEAEPFSRPQGIEYRVRLPRDATPSLVAPDSDVPATPSDVSAPIGERSDLEAAALTGSAHVTTQAVSAAITAAVAPLTERLVVQDVTIARQAETIQQQAGEIAGLREDRGRLSAENAALRAAQAQQEAREPPQPAEPTVADTRTARLRTLAPWLLVVPAIVMVIVLLVVFR